MRSPAGQLQGRFAVQPQWVTAPDLKGGKAGQHAKRGVDVAGVDRPGPGSEHVVLLDAEPDTPENVGLRVVSMFSYPREDACVVVGVAGAPPVGLASLVEAFLAVLTDGFQEPVAGREPVFFGHNQ